jgi:hypothetical protein
MSLSMLSLEIKATGSKDYGPCECCGNNSRMVSGFVGTPQETLASYSVHWTLGRVADHGANFDLIIGHWGQDADAADRCLVALAYRLFNSGPEFMVIDAEDRPSAKSDLVGRILRRSDVIGQTIAEQSFALVDAILAQDGRVAELLGPWRMGPPPRRPWWKFW